MTKEVFEVIAKDGAARVGRLETRHGTVETPCFVPVVNPHLPVVSPDDLKKLGFQMFICNAYVFYRDEKLRELALRKGIHGVFGWDRAIMTDSGAFQLMAYKDVEITNLEILEFQRKIGVDIGVILDVPVASGSREVRLRAIEETAKRAKEAADAGYLEGDMIVVGPVHGAPIPDLVEYAADLMTQFDFPMYGVGSAVPLMEEYRYLQLIKACLAAKRKLPPNRPVHLFGAGHPASFALFVLLGFDTFDSAAYALYARDNRYMTPEGTYHLRDLKWFPCDCPVCTSYTPKELLSMDDLTRQHLLALHNLYVCQAEIRRIKQAIYEGTLWELVAKRASAHPELARAYRWLLESDRAFEYFETYEPTYKRHGVMITRIEELNLPVVRRYKQRLLERLYVWSDKLIITTPAGADALPWYLGAQVFIVHPVFGVIPREIRHVYPLFQHMSYLDRIPEQSLAFAKSVLTHVIEHYGMKEVYVFAPKRHEARELMDALGIEAELYEGQDVGVIKREEWNRHVARAMFRYQWGPGAEELIKSPFFEYSPTTNVLRKIYERDVSKEEVEKIVVPEIERIVERRKKKGMFVPEDPYEYYFGRSKMWLVAALNPANMKMIPHRLIAYRFWRHFYKEKGELRYMLVARSDTEPFISKGLTLFCKHVVALDERIRAEDECFIVGESGKLLAIGRALLSAKEIKHFKKGAACEVRQGFEGFPID